MYHCIITLGFDEMWCVTLAQIFGFTMGIMRFEYEKSSQSIGLTMENMRFEYEKCSNTIGFALEIMRYCMRNHPNPLDLQWRT